MTFIAFAFFLVGEIYDEYLDSCNDSWFWMPYRWIDIYRSNGDLECIK